MSQGKLLDLVEPWITSLRQRSPHTARSYEECVTRFLGHVNGRQIDGRAVSGYLHSLEGLAPASRAHHVSAVRSFLRYAQGQGLVAKSPTELLVRPRVAITSMNRYLDEAELRQLLKAAKALGPRHDAAVRTLATTGLRVSELAQAEWRHLFRDPEGRLGLMVVGKGGKERVAKVPAEVFSLLAELHGSADLDARDRSPLLPDSRRSSFTANGIWRLVKAAAERAGLRKPVSPHYLRHTAATLAAKGGANVFTIQAALGHARLETSQRYLHMARGLEDGLSDYLPAL